MLLTNFPPSEVITVGLPTLHKVYALHCTRFLVYLAIKPAKPACSCCLLGYIAYSCYVRSVHELPSVNYKKWKRSTDVSKSAVRSLGSEATAPIDVHALAFQQRTGPAP